MSKLTKNQKLEKQNKKLIKEIQRIRNSKAFRLGMFILAIPRKIKHAIKKK